MLERTTEQRLAALRLTSQDFVRTAAGVLAIGIEPLAFVPGACVRFLHLDGDGLDAPIKDEKRLERNLLDVLGELLELNITTALTSPPAVADLLRGLGYVQRFGMGLPSTRRVARTERRCAA